MLSLNAAKFSFVAGCCKMILESSLLKGAAVYSLSNIINAMIPFLLLPVLTRVLIPADYGVIAMFTSALGILAAFTGLSAHGAINSRYYEQDKIDFPGYVGSCFSILLFSTLITLAITTFFQAALSDFTTLPPFWLIMAVVTSGCNALIQIRLGIWLMGKKPFSYGVFQMLLSILNALLSLYLVLSLHQGYSGRLWGQVLAASVFACAGLASLYREGWINFRPRWDYVREGLVFGFPLMPHVIGNFLVSLADRFIINRQLGLKAAGIYMVAVQIAMGVLLVTDACNKTFIPWLYEKLTDPTPETKIKIVKITWVYFGVALVCACVLGLISHWIIFIVAGGAYENAAKPLSWLFLGQAFGGMYFMVTNYVFYMRQTMILSWITLFSGCSGIALTWFFVPIFGISGAGVSFAFAMLLRFLMTWYLANRVCPMPWFKLYRNPLSP